MSWAVINRRTAKLEESDHGLGDAAGLKLLADRIDARYKVSPYYLVVVNLSGSSAALPDGVRLLKSLGVDTVGGASRAQAADLGRRRPGIAGGVGVHVRPADPVRPEQSCPAPRPSRRAGRT